MSQRIINVFALLNESDGIKTSDQLAGVSNTDCLSIELFKNTSLNQIVQCNIGYGHSLRVMVLANSAAVAT